MRYNAIQIQSAHENKKIDAEVNAEVKTNRLNEANKTNGMNGINYKVALYQQWNISGRFYWSTDQAVGLTM